MNKLSFHIIPSPESNDHQARILIDGEDWLGDEFLGIDPTSFFPQQTFSNGWLLVGRCTCGVEGCGDNMVDVHEEEDRIIWTRHDGIKLQFDKFEYLATLEQAKADYSWEDLNRRVERLLIPVLAGSQTTDGLDFEWASCRFENNLVVVAYGKPGIPLESFDQGLLRFRWDGQTEDDALAQARTFLQTHKRIKK